MVFSDSFARDDILTRGPMLSDYRDAKGKPTAGIRLDIPGHLMGVFKSLEAFGFALRRKHGPTLRKHIKFDELEETLYIQAGIKEEEDKPVDWTTYSAAEARDALKVLNAKKGPRIDLLKSPTANNAAGLATGGSNGGGTSAGGTRKKTTNQNAPAFPWVPPTRKEPDAEQTTTWEAPTRNMDTTE